MIARLFAILFICASSAMASGTRPNIVFVLFDDMGLGDVSSYNPDSKVQTVNIDALADAGMRFTNAHSASGICSPTRWSIMTGSHPFRIGRETHFQKDYDDSWFKKDPTPTVAEMLKAQGYNTSYIGKWHLGYSVFKSDGTPFGKKSSSSQSNKPDWRRGIKDHPFDVGFDYAYGHTSSNDIPPYKFYENDRWVDTAAVWVTKAKAQSSGIAKASDGSGIGALRSGWMDRDWNFNMVQRRLSDKAVEQMESLAKDKKPFFLFVGLSGPHTPTVPHADFMKTTPYNYTDFVNELDVIIGTLVATLENKGVLKNTLFILTSDNGADGRFATPGTHWGPGILNGKKVKGHKSNSWEGGHRVPYIARWGDGTPEGSVIKPGTVNNELMNLQDFMRTVAAVVDTSLGKDVAVDSWNMLPAFLGEGTTRYIREAQFSTSFRGHFAITKQYPDGGEWKMIFGSGSGGFSFADGTKNFSGPINFVNPDQDFEKLNKSNLQFYDMANDIWETKNLDTSTDAEHQTIMREMHSLMREYITTARSNARDPDTSKMPAVGTRGIPVAAHARAPISVSLNAEKTVLNLDLGSEVRRDLRLEILTLDGRIVFSEFHSKAGGRLRIRMPDAARGTLVLRMISGNAPVFLKRLILL